MTTQYYRKSRDLTPVSIVYFGFKGDPDFPAKVILKRKGRLMASVIFVLRDGNFTIISGDASGKGLIAMRRIMAAIR